MARCNCDPGDQGSHRSGGSSELSVDEVLDLLANDQRRYLLFCLTSQADDVAKMEDIVDCLMSKDHVAEHTDRESLVRQCHHAHLPRLADANVIDYDARSNTIRYYPHEFVEEILELIVEFEEVEGRPRS